MTQPLSPAEALGAKAGIIPAYVVEAANTLLVKNLSLEGQATVLLPELIDLAVANAQQAGLSVSRQTMIENRWFDIEPLFRAVGWKVQFTKPPYYDSTPASFSFSRA